MIHEQLPLPVPCYDLAPLTESSLGPLARNFGYPQLAWLDGRWVQDSGTYSSPRSWLAITSNSNFMRASFSPQSELGPALVGLSSSLRFQYPLYRPLYHVCSPGHQGPCWFGVILTFLPIISGSPLWHVKHRARVAFVTPIKGTSQDTNWRQPCSTCLTVLRSSTFIEWSVRFLVLVRFFACCRIKPHGPPLVWVPVYSFEF